MRPFRPRSCNCCLKASRSSSEPFSAQEPFGFPGSRRFVQMKTCLSKCGSAMCLGLSQTADVAVANPPLEAVGEAHPHPVLIALEQADSQAGVDLEAGLVVWVGALLHGHLIG